MKKSKSLIVIILFSVLGLTFSSCSEPIKPIQEVEKRPNFLLIVADDMGWTDLGSFGSEINTPNIDKLANNGVKFTDFHVSVSCSPTRSMLLTGTDNHIAGLGIMAEFLDPNEKIKPGYEGHINNSVVTLAEVLRDGGYHTYLSGKWHLGHEPEQYPSARGFEQSFSMLYGGASYWSDKSGVLANVQEVAKYVEGDKEIDELPKDFYASRNYTDYLMNSIRSNKADDKPFLAYLSYTAVHDPIQVPEPWRSKYKGQYDNGYGELKARRSEAAKNIGVFPIEAQAQELNHLAKPWESLSAEEKAKEAKAMEVYAGLLSNMDYHIGRVIDFLKDIGEYDNTVIIFLSDNGSNPWYSEDYPGNRGSDFMASFDNSVENLGAPNSHYAYGMGWGSASSGPLHLFKAAVGEGGIRSPLIIAGPGIKGKRKVEAFSYVTDIMPTILEMANITHPNEFNGHKVARMRGKSITKVLSGKQEKVYDNTEIIAGEMANGRWARLGDYKASFVPEPYGEAKWKLFNLKTDPGETTDLSANNPELLKKIIEGWNQYASEVGVLENDFNF